MKRLTTIRTRKNRQHYQRVCEWCRDVFHANREHARFCGTACRTASHRWDRKGATLSLFRRRVELRDKRQLANILAWKSARSKA